VTSGLGCESTEQARWQRECSHCYELQLHAHSAELMCAIAELLSHSLCAACITLLRAPIWALFVVTCICWLIACAC
jgi:hypothetical protein